MSARCERIEEWLGRYVAGELSDARRARVATHLEACAGCRRQADEAAALDELVATSFADHPFGDDLADRIVAGVRGVRGGRSAGGPRVLAGPGSWRVALPFAVAAALLLAVGLGVRRWVAPEPSARVAPRAIATVQGISGRARVSVRQGGNGPAVTATPGSQIALRPGDRVLVESEGAEVRFRDGTVVHVRPDTEITVVATAMGESGRSVGVRIIGGPGEVFCSVRHRPVGAAFRVDTPQGEVEVLGTRFGVRCEGARTVATILSGAVRVRGAWGGEWASVLAGRRVVFDPAARMALAVTRTNAAVDLAWALSSAGSAPAAGGASAAQTGTDPSAGAASSAGPGPAAAPGAAPAAGSSLDLPIGASPHDDD